MERSKIEINLLSRNHMNGVIEILQEISNFRPTESELNEIWNSFHKQNNIHSVVAMFDNKVVGYGSIVVETKIRGGRMGHIEDIASHADYRNIGVGRRIMDELFKIAKEQGCYKVSLQCREHNVPFYEKCGYEVSGFAMQKFL